MGGIRWFMMIRSLTIILVVVLGLLYVPVCAWVDYIIMGHWLRCYNCGARPERWFWVLPCFVETLIFFMGILSGLAIGGVL